MTNLSVNLNKVAMLRNARPLTIPSVVKKGKLSIAAGAHGLTVHPRPDERDVRPDQCTLVPDDPTQNTSDHGWNVAKDAEKLRPIIAELNELGCRVSLFMDPDIEQIKRVPALKCERIELYTAPYATAHREGTGDESFDVYKQAAECAQSLGIGVNGGHDLNLDNLPKFKEIPNLLEVSIGHALTADALEMGYANAVKAYLKALA